jgi:prepilin-type N-terminal cleavage/methylation domain-containing protein
MNPQRCRGERGFSLLEMSMVLVIIGVMMGAVMVGTDVLRHAKGQQAFSVFISGWRDAFSQYVQVVGGVPGDANPPLNVINGRAGPNPPTLCGDQLIELFLNARIRIPQGRAVGLQTQYVYQDSDGAPRNLQVCFRTLDATAPADADADPGPGGWSVQTGVVPGAVPELVFAGTNRHVMEITGLTTELAMQMDVLVDGSISARFGQFRDRRRASRLDEDEFDWGPLEDNTGAQRQVIAFFEMF